MTGMTVGSTAIGRQAILNFMANQPNDWLSRSQIRDGIVTGSDTEADLNWLLYHGLVAPANVDFYRITERGSAFLVGVLSEVSPQELSV